jgi:hypothetical protein
MKKNISKMCKLHRISNIHDGGFIRPDKEITENIFYFLKDFKFYSWHKILEKIFLSQNRIFKRLCEIIKLEPIGKM